MVDKKKKVINIFLLVFVLVLMLLILTGCNEKDANNEEKVRQTASNKVEINNSSADNATNSSSAENEKNEEDIVNNFDYKQAAEKQMAMPEDGEEIAILSIKNYGDVKVKFFPEVAPKAVENFVTHAKEGYYDGLTFHRVINEFMIQGGDPKGNGTGGESIWGTGFGTELDYSLVPYRGSLCMAMSSLPNSIGSQFFITQANYNDSMVSYLKQGGYPEGVIEQYKEYGGYLSLYLQYTVFGQVFEGMEVVDEIAKNTPVTDNNGTVEKGNQPIIEKIEVMKYSKK